MISGNESGSQIEKRRKTMKKALALVLAAMMVLSLVACGEKTPSTAASTEAPKESTSQEMTGIQISTQETSDKEPEYAKEVTLALSLADLDPGVAWNATRESYQRFVFDTLIYYDDNTGDVTMQLAKTCEWANEDCSKLHVVLRDDIKFSNGEPLTAADVQFSFDRNTYSSMTSNYDHIEIKNDYEFDIILKGPCSAFMAILSRACAAVVCKKAAEADANQLALIGSGPYKYDMNTYVAANKIDLVRNDLFWGEEKNPTEVFHIVKLADAAASAVALQSGDINYFVSVNESDLAALEANDKIDVLRYTSWNFIYLGFNDKTDTNAVSEEELNFRRAVACAINKQDIVDGLGGGSVMVNMWPFTDAGALTNESDYKDDLSYNPEKAMEYLAKAGGKTEFTVLVDTGRNWVKLAAQVVMAYLEQVGIKMNIEETDSTGMSAMTKWGKLDYDATLWSNLFVIDAVNLNYFTEGSGVNRVMMDSPEIKAAIDEFKAASTAEGKAEAAKKLQTICHDHVSYLPLVWREMNMAYTKGLENFSCTPSPTYNYRGMRLRLN